MKQSMKALLVAGVLGVSATACMTHAADTFTGVTYGNGTITITHEGTSITMKDKNLGATGVDYGASASTDSYGNYYQWGGTTGYAYSLDSTGAINAGFVKDKTAWNTTTASITDWGQGPCPSGYHVPTSEEWNTVLSMYEAEGNRLSTFYQAFKIPFAGNRGYRDAEMGGTGDGAVLWSASPRGDEGVDYLIVYDGGAAVLNDTRVDALPVRCFANSSSPSSSDLSAETEINLTILEGALKLISNVSAITFDSITASLSNTGITASFNDFIEVEDLKGSSSGYYVTVDASDLVSDLASNTGFYTIPKSNLTFNPNSSTFKREGSDNAQVKVGETHTFEGGGFTYIYRENNTQAGILGKYGTKPSLTINVPANTPAATYHGTITFTLFEGSENSVIPSTLSLACDGLTCPGRINYMDCSCIME